MENTVFNLQNLAALFDGFCLTVIISVVTCAVSFVFGTFLAITRNYGDKLSKALATFYIELFRNTPLLLWMLGACFVLPAMLGIRANLAIWGTIGFSLYTSSVMAEIIRGGLNSIPEGQFEAAYSQGFTSFFTLFYIVLPQALRLSIPALLSQVITTVKDTSFLAGLTVAELTYESKIILAKLSSFSDILLMIGLIASIYFIICFALSVLVRVYAEKTKYGF